MRAVRRWYPILIVVAAVVLAAGLFALGRYTAGTGAARDRGYAAGRADGEADGVRVGRALQLTQSLPPDVQGATRDAYAAGYTAGENDAFNGYDGGWDLSTPYVVVLVPGGDGVTYRIGTRTELRDGTDYYLCPGSRTLCQQPRR